MVVVGAIVIAMIVSMNVINAHGRNLIPTDRQLNRRRGDKRTYGQDGQKGPQSPQCSNARHTARIAAISGRGNALQTYAQCIAGSVGV